MFYCSYNSKTRDVEGKKHIVRGSEFRPNEKTMLLHLLPFSTWCDKNARPKPKKWVHKRTVDIGTSFPVFVLDGDFEIWCEEEGRYLSPREVEAKGYFMNHGEIMYIEPFTYAFFRGWQEHEGEFEVYMPLGGGGWMRVRTKITERKPSLIEIIEKYDGRCEEDRVACLAEVRVALEAGADVNEQDEKGRTLLMKAVRTRGMISHDDFQRLIKSRTDLTLRDIYGYTIADYVRFYEIPADMLHDMELAEQASFNDTTEAHTDLTHGGNILHCLLRHTWLDVLHDEEDCDILELVQRLCISGIEVNALDSRGRTPLMLAMKSDFAVQLASLLMEYGADPAIRDANGFAALNYAHFYDASPEVLELLTPKE